MGSQIKLVDKCVENNTYHKRCVWDYLRTRAKYFESEVEKQLWAISFTLLTIPKKISGRCKTLTTSHKKTELDLMSVFLTLKISSQLGIFTIRKVLEEPPSQ